MPQEQPHGQPHPDIQMEPAMRQLAHFPFQCQSLPKHKDFGLSGTLVFGKPIIHKAF
ncbi:hypothetical protein [Nostoc sp.]|uniref:hypothetical protein n=1 Tax=Nostoc sp. TaxID=1180 RepID=UPI002FF55265